MEKYTEIYKNYKNHRKNMEKLQKNHRKILEKYTEI